jgi:Rrf2 family protein
MQAQRVPAPAWSPHCDERPTGGGQAVRITAKTDYALKACAHLAGATPGQYVKADEIARAQAMPLEFLENILRELRRGGLVDAQRGADGGYRLTRPAATISVGDVVRTIDSPITEPSPVAAGDDGVGTVWRALDGAVLAVLEAVTLADVVAGVWPDVVVQFTGDGEGELV